MSNENCEDFCEDFRKLTNKKEIDCYVYRLVDPRSGETFYVGKGTGNRVCDHVNGSLAANQNDDDVEDSVSLKIQQIQDIHNAGLSVIHIIHRHGMDDECCLEVEAALIDAYPGLTNIQTGNGSSDRGSRHINEIVSQYTKAEANFGKYKVILININRTGTSPSSFSIYDQVRHAWKVNVARAIKADFICATEKGLILEVYEAPKAPKNTKDPSLQSVGPVTNPHMWKPSNAVNFPSHKAFIINDRWGFTANKKDLHGWTGKRVPFKLARQKGAANPIRYNYK